MSYCGSCGVPTYGAGSCIACDDQEQLQEAFNRKRKAWRYVSLLACLASVIATLAVALRCDLS